jgi:dipeptidyl aminopeptidase/acylaminoacyl peptidase
MLTHRTIQLMLAILLGLSFQIVSVGGRGSSTAADLPLPIEESLAAVYFPFRMPTDLSPDGKWISYTLRDPNKAILADEDERNRYFTDTGVSGNEIGCDIWITHVITRETRNLTQGKGSSYGPVWSPDGTQLAFYSDRSGQTNLWVWNVASNRLSQVSDVIVRPRDGFDLIRWTKDSSKVLIKVLAEGQSLKEANEAIVSLRTREQEKRQPGSTVTIYRSKTGPAVNQDATASLHPLIKSLRADLALIDIKSQKLERIAKGYYPLWYDFSPDEQSIAFTTSKGQAGNNNYRTLYDLIVISKGQLPQVVAADISQSALWVNVGWSPDGKWLSYGVFGEAACYLAPAAGGPVRKVTIGGVPPLFLRPPTWDRASENVYLSTSKGLWRVSVSNGSATELPRIADRRVITIVGRRDDSQLWTIDNGASIVVVTLNDDTKQSGFYKIDLATGAYSRLLEEDKSYGMDFDFNHDVSDDGQTIVYTSEDGGHCRNFWTVNTNFQQPRPVTDINPQFNRYAMGKGRIIEWRSLSGQKLRGVLVLPAGYVENRRYPLIVRVYGGWMQSDVLHTFGFTPAPTIDNLQLFATRGYALLLPDAPLGAGTPMKELADTVLPGVNKAIEVGVADPEKLGVMGQSFGGYNTLSLIVQTTRFRAAIMRGGFGSLIGIYGEMGKNGLAYGTGVMEDGPPRMRGTPWEFRERYIENSPIFYLDRVQTPLLIVHGAEDGAAAPFLADEVFVGLRRLGREAVYAKYQGEGHGFQMYANKVDYWYRALEWFDKHLQPQTVSDSR